MLQKPKPRKWIVRSPGLPPLSGCGVLPVPSMEYLVSPTPSSSPSPPAAFSASPDTPVPSVTAVPVFFMLLRLSLPNGEVKSLPVSELDSILRLKLLCEELLGIHFYRLRLLLRGISLSRLFHLHTLPLEDEDDHRKILNTGISLGDIITVEIISTNLLLSSSPSSYLSDLTNVCLIGAGPVGLWIAIQLKVLRPAWSVTCFEKRRQYERSHALSISARAFEGMVEWCPGRPAAAELSMLKERWIPRTRTSVVEEDLRNLAIAVGVKIVYGHEITSLTQLATQTQGGAEGEAEAEGGLGGEAEGGGGRGRKWDLILCCDGAKGPSRKQLLTSYLHDPNTATHLPQSATQLLPNQHAALPSPKKGF
jgi:hypothetical protein